MSEEAAREARRMERLSRLKRMRDVQLEMAERMNDAVAGRLAEEEAAKFAEVKDPCLAVARLGRTFDLIVKHEERIDVDAETRTARGAEERAKELAEQEKARRWDETAPKRAQQAEAQARKARKIASIRCVVTRAYQDATPDMERFDRREELDNAFDQYEEDENYDGDSAEIAAVLMTDLRIEPEAEPEPVDVDRPYGAKKTPATAVEAKARLAALARRYLDELAAEELGEDAPDAADTS